MAGRTYRLPSEAEWEYACRAGTITPFSLRANDYDRFGKLQRQRHLWSRAEGRVSGRNYRCKVAFLANAFGLHDMHGNVWEWCQDVWHDNYEGAPTDGSAWVDGGDQERKVLRGGSWGYNPGYCRSAGRYGSAPDFIFDFVGFRVVCGRRVGFPFALLPSCPLHFFTFPFFPSSRAARKKFFLRFWGGCRGRGDAFGIAILVTT